MASNPAQPVLVGCGDVPSGVYSDRTLWSAAIQAASTALEETPGVERYIDAVLVSGVISSGAASADMTFSRLPAELGLHDITNNEQVFAGGATGTAMLRHASALIEAGLARGVLCVYSDRLGSGLPLQEAIDIFGTLGTPFLWEGRLGQYFNPMLALVTSAYMHETSCTEEDLAAVVAGLSEWGARNPHAMLRKRVSVADVMASRYISDPLKVLEICHFADGSSAYVMVRRDIAREHVERAVGIEAIGSAWSHYSLSCDPRFPRMRIREAGERAFAKAGIGPADIDLLELYDTYPVLCLMQLEELGFCEVGEGRDLVASGATRPGGELPMTTNGGMLRKGHTGPGGGFELVVEAVRQLTGKAGDRQVEAESALVTGMGGSYMNEDVAILRGITTL